MKYSDVIRQLPRLLRLDDACDYVACETILRHLEKQGWLKPVFKSRGVTAYDRHEIDAAIEKLKLSGQDRI